LEFLKQIEGYNEGTQSTWDILGICLANYGAPFSDRWMAMENLLILSSPFFELEGGKSEIDQPSFFAL